MSKLPPVPPANRSPGDKSQPDNAGHNGDKAPRDRQVEEQGQQGNTYQNTRHPGHQQDR